MEGASDDSDGPRPRGSKGALLVVLSALSILLVLWKQDGGRAPLDAETELRVRAQALALNGRKLRAGVAQAAHTEQQLALAKGALVRTAAARLADMKRTPRKGTLTAQSLAGVETEGRDCWGGCAGQQGICSWCGPFGMCCKFGFADTSNGCDGRIGVEGLGHVCAAVETKSSNFETDPLHYPNVPKPPRPPGCHRGFHGTIMGCGDAHAGASSGYGAPMQPTKGFVGNFWATDSVLTSLPDFDTLGDPKWSDTPHTIRYKDQETFAKIADDFPADKFAARWTVLLCARTVAPKDVTCPADPSSCLGTYVEHTCSALKTNPLTTYPLRGECARVVTVLCVAGLHLHRDPRCLPVLLGERRRVEGVY